MAMWLHFMPKAILGGAIFALWTDNPTGGDAGEGVSRGTGAKRRLTGELIHQQHQRLGEALSVHNDFL